jgi:ubiquinone/menaquinone biosynthesis C-methylase UbiE
MTGHGYPGHTAGHHHEFKGIEQWINHLDNPEREKKQLPTEVIVRLGLQRYDVVADIGAGTGYFAIRIAEAYPQVRVIAADSEPEMIDYLKAQATARKIANLEPVIIDPSKPHLPVKANLALIVDTLHHIDHRVEYLKFLGKNMAPGSRIAVIDYPTESRDGPPPELRIPIVEVVDELKQAGYTLEQNMKLLPNQYFLIFKQE